ncbi:LemA family protein [bacterium]|nr:LemA family protein [bacterium]MBU1073479.1 LemA family protein [bacterium]MBU1675846.1 LemA family protein [bacterium]
MSKGVLITIAVLAVIAFAVIGLVGKYNAVVGQQEDVEGQWGNVQNVYQRRADLIPNLVETVKGYAAHERETLEAVINARARATQVSAEITPETLNDPQFLQQFQQAQDGLSQALGRLMVVIERYPDLKANQNFLELQNQLEGTENRIAVERRRFNDMARDYNTTIRRFPTNLVAGMFGFEKRAYFEAAGGAEQAPAVNFGE